MRSGSPVVYFEQSSYQVVLIEQFERMDILQKIVYSTFVAAFAIILFSCSGKGDDIHTTSYPEPTQVITAQGVSVPVYDMKALRQMMDMHNDTVRIYNFWAPWCLPCVKELPYFNMADSAYSNKPVKMYLVSIDFVENIEDVLIPFILENELSPEVIVLDDMDANSWIPQVDPVWEGNIPATLYKKNSHRKFVASPLTYDELVEDIEYLLYL